ncbi:hypothetical protein [Nonomuraea salmonea]|uniref:hypothetical protein n=1 Tax=Nonomuraea salmonea TaxID=46181 RepID=UPI0031E67EC0
MSADLAAGLEARFGDRAEVTESYGDTTIDVPPRQTGRTSSNTPATPSATPSSTG